MSAAERGNTGLYLIMIDVDQFKAYNDAYGHSAGDAVLCRVGFVLDEIPSSVGGMVARYGGEEFVVAVPCSDRVEASLIAESLLRAVSSMAEPSAGSDHGIVTISAGYANRSGQDSQLDPLAAADAALYRAKRAGRNRCCSASPDQGRRHGGHFLHDTAALKLRPDTLTACGLRQIALTVNKCFPGGYIDQSGAPCRLAMH